MPLLLVLVIFGGAGIAREYVRSRKAPALNATATTILHLLWVFAQLSVLGFGGGKGIIPQMHVDAVTTYGWVSSAQFTQFYTIGKLVPGPTTIFAALIGYAAMPSRPLLGAAAATVGDVRSIERHHGRVRCALGALPGVAVARDHLPWAGTGDCRFGLVERVDDRTRRTGVARSPTPLPPS